MRETMTFASTAEKNPVRAATAVSTRRRRKKFQAISGRQELLSCVAGHRSPTKQGKYTAADKFKQLLRTSFTLDVVLAFLGK